MAFSFISCSRPLTKKQEFLRERSFVSAQNFFGSGEIDSSLIYLDKCLEQDNDYAPAHHLLGKIYLEKDGIYNRRLSAEALREAIKGDEQNAEYHYSLGLTLEKQSFYMNALDEFHETARLDSMDPRPYVKIAALNERMGLRYDDDKYFQRSLEASAKAALLSDDPTQYYHQAATLYQLGQFDSSGIVLTRAIALTDSARILSQCWLLMASMQALEKRYDSAQFCFDSARSLMSSMARDEMDDFRYLMTVDQYKNYINEGPVAQENTERQFWGEVDPDPTTEINERRLEHYARFVHAQLTFSLPDRKIDGWMTKRGELYIRYGPPTSQEFTLGEGPNDPPRWTWTYDRFGDPVVLYFEDTFLNGDFQFPFPNKNWTAANYAFDPSRLANELGSAIPQDFRFSPGSGPLEFSYMPRQFKGPGGVCGNSQCATRISAQWGILVGGGELAAGVAVSKSTAGRFIECGSDVHNPGGADGEPGTDHSRPNGTIGIPRYDGICHRDTGRSIESYRDRDEWNAPTQLLQRPGGIIGYRAGSKD
jgi:GWxTD domain-containing protein